jgi:hypothetical protein
MPTALPIIRGSSTALYPFTQTYICLTGKSDGQSSMATRWVAGLPLVRFEFSYDLLKQADKNTLKAAFVSAKGQFATDLQATVGSAFNALSFDEDEFQGLEQQSTQYGVKWSLTQTLPQNLSPGASGGAFPLLSTGALSQLPYSQKKRFQTIVSRMASGPKYTYSQFGGGLTGFPTDGLMGWEFTESGLTDAEVTTKTNHFLANWGSCFEFAFVDEDVVTYSHVHYASDQLVIQRASYNRSSIKTELVQLS